MNSKKWVREFLRVTVCERDSMRDLQGYKYKKTDIHTPSFDTKKKTQRMS